MITQEVFREYSFKPQRYPTVFDMLQQGHIFYVTVEDKQRVKLNATYAKLYLSYCIVPTNDSEVYLLMTHEGTVVGVLETDTSISRVKLDLEVNLSAFFGVVPEFYFTNIGILNSLTFNGSITSGFVTIKKMHLCTNLFKIIANNCVVRLLDRALFACSKLWYCKGQFVLSGTQCFENCSSLRNVDGILCNCFPARSFCGCDKLEYIKVLDEPYDFTVVEPHIGKDAFLGCNDNLEFRFRELGIIVRKSEIDTPVFQETLLGNTKTNLFNGGN